MTENGKINGALQELVDILERLIGDNAEKSMTEEMREFDRTERIVPICRAIVALEDLKGDE